MTDNTQAQSQAQPAMVAGQDPTIAARAAEMGVAYEVAANAVAIEHFLSDRSGVSVMDIAPLRTPEGEFDDYTQATIQVSTPKARTEIVEVAQPDGTVAKVKQPKLDADGNPMYSQHKDVAVVAIASPGEVGLTWEQVQETALEAFTALITGTIYAGMKKKGFSYRQGEAIKFSNIMRFFDVTDLPSLASALMPRILPKLSDSEKQKAALKACAIGDSEQTNSLHEWLTDKAINNIVFTITQGGAKPLGKKKEDDFRKVAGFALTFTLEGKMKGSKPNMEKFAAAHKAIAMTAMRLKRNHDKVHQQFVAAGDNVEPALVDKLHKLELAYKAMEHFKCNSDSLNSALTQLAAKAALSAAAKTKPAVEGTAPTVSEDDLI